MDPLRPGDIYEFGFNVRKSDGTIDASPTLTLTWYKNGAADGAVTPTALLTGGTRRFQATVPSGYAPGDRVAGLVQAVTSDGTTRKKWGPTVKLVGWGPTGVILANVAHTIKGLTIDATGTGSAALRVIGDAGFSGMTVSGNGASPIALVSAGGDNFYEGVSYDGSTVAIAGMVGIEDVTDLIGGVPNAVWSFSPSRSLTDKDGFTLTTGERSAIAAAVEVALLNEGDGRAVQAALVAKIAAANPDLSGLTLSAIAQTVWNYLTASATTNGSFGKLLAVNVDATIGSRASQESVDAIEGGGGGGGTDWTDEERAQIRHQLGIDGASSAPSEDAPDPVVVTPPADPDYAMGYLVDQTPGTVYTFRRTAAAGVAGRGWSEEPWTVEADEDGRVEYAFAVGHTYEGCRDGGEQVVIGPVPDAGTFALPEMLSEAP